MIPLFYRCFNHSSGHADMTEKPQSSRQALTPAAVSVQGQIKWFSEAKGFGFVTLTDGQDAFLHISALSATGRTGVPDGATLVVDTGTDPNGRLQVTGVHSLDESTARAPSGPAHRTPIIGPAATQAVNGTLKWYSSEKGYGFVVPADGSKDIFVHATAFSRSGMAVPEPGAAVQVLVREGRRGLEADSIRLAGASPAWVRPKQQ
jgi:CspA family cold shock protein